MSKQLYCCKDEPGVNIPTATNGVVRESPLEIKKNINL
jgi:hypothetical protein